MTGDPNNITIVISSANLGGIAWMGWWLSGRFRKVEVSQRALLDQSAKEHREQLDKHEELDQRRHEENLRRFEKISVSLARMGSDNGT